MLKKFLITGGIGLAAYVINEVRKEYDKNVEDYNNLLDKYNKSPNSGKRYIKETQVMPDGSTQTITKDAATGFSVVSNNRA